MKEERKLWEHPWGYKESFLIALEILLVGFFIEIVTKQASLPIIALPYNIIIGIVLLTCIIMLKVIFGSRPIVKWLSSIPAAVSSISLLAFLSVLLGFLPSEALKQNEFASKLGLAHLKVSWPFLLSQLYFLLALGMATMRRIKPLNKNNIGFLLNHLGLWIIIFSALLGAGDLKRLSVTVSESGEYVDFATDHQGKKYRLPFAIKLNDFHIEQYPPKLAILSLPDYNIEQSISNNLVMIPDTGVIQMDDYFIKVVKYYEDATLNNGVYIENKVYGAAPAAFIQVINKKQNIEKSGWISPGTFATRNSLLNLNNKIAIGLTSPEPKVYSSDLEIQQTDGTKENVEIIVNKPFKYNRWKIYQTGYDSQRGKYSQISILEAVFDPWLPAVYTGIFMLLAGSIYLFWSRKGERDDNE